MLGEIIGEVRDSYDLTLAQKNMLYGVLQCPIILDHEFIIRNLIN